MKFGLQADKKHKDVTKVIKIEMLKINISVKNRNSSKSG